jgi:hypothetical protein
VKGCLSCDAPLKSPVNRPAARLNPIGVPDEHRLTPDASDARHRGVGADLVSYGKALVGGGIYDGFDAIGSAARLSPPRIAYPPHTGSLQPL